MLIVDKAFVAISADAAVRLGITGYYLFRAGALSSRLHKCRRLFHDDDAGTLRVVLSRLSACRVYLTLGDGAFLMLV